MTTIRSWKRVRKVIAVQTETFSINSKGKKKKKKCSRYLCEEHSFIHVSTTQSHCSSKGLKDTQGHNIKRLLTGSSKVFLRKVWDQDVCVCKQHTIIREHVFLTSMGLRWATCELMCPAACISATSAELLTALREWMRGLRVRGVGPFSSRGLRWVWCSRGWTGGEPSYHSREPVFVTFRGSFTFFCHAVQSQMRTN